jgi:hypothetical protein
MQRRERHDHALDPVVHRLRVHAGTMIVIVTGGISVGHHGDDAVEGKRARREYTGKPHREPRSDLQLEPPVDG